MSGGTAGWYSDPLYGLPAGYHYCDKAEVVDMYSWRDLFDRQQTFSERTFGPVSFRTQKGPLDHIRKEAKEAYDEADRVKRLEEYADIAILLMDAVWRDGRTLDDLRKAIGDKQDKNWLRKWPDWRQSDPARSLEHDRSREKP